MTFQLIFLDINMVCLLCWMLLLGFTGSHGFLRSPTHTYPPKSYPVLKPAIWHKMDVVDRQSPGDTTRVAYEASVTGRAIYISLCAFSLTATQFPVPSGELLTASQGLECNLWSSQRAQPPQSISPPKPWTLLGKSFIPGPGVFQSEKKWSTLKETRP